MKKQYNNLSPEEKEDVIRVNRIKSNLNDSIEDLWQRALYILLFGIIVFSISSEKVNQNTIFSYFTLAQGIILVPIYLILVRKKRKLKFLFIGFAIYVGIWLIEIIFFGLPNDLLAAYNTIRVTGSGIGMRPTKVEFLYREKYEGRDVILIFPYVYSGIKLIFGYILFNAYRNYNRLNNLPTSLKEKLWE